MTIAIALLVVAIAALVGWYFFTQQGALGGAAQPAELAPDARIIDLRSASEYRISHLSGAINIPIRALPKRMEGLGAKDRQMVLYCKTGADSAKGASLLREAGFTAVVDAGAMSKIAAAAAEQGGQAGQAAGQGAAQPVVNRQQRRAQQRAQRRKRR